MFTFTTTHKQVLGDLHTPVSIYLKVRDIYPESALLESSDFHGNENSLSYIALCPLASIGINNGESTMQFPDGTSEVRPLSDGYSVPDAINDFLSRFEVEGERRDVCGLFGYTAFDAVRYFEKIPVMEAHHEENDAPDMLYILYKYIIIFNHFKNELTLVELLRPNEKPHLKEIETLIDNRNYASYNFEAVGPEQSPITDEDYRQMVREGIRHCLRGDVYNEVFLRVMGEDGLPCVADGKFGERRNGGKRAFGDVRLNLQPQRGAGVGFLPCRGNRSRGRRQLRRRAAGRAEKQKRSRAEDCRRQKAKCCRPESWRRSSSG